MYYYSTVNIEDKHFCRSDDITQKKPY